MSLFFLSIWSKRVEGRVLLLFPPFASSYLDEPREALVGLVLRRDRGGPRELELGQLDLGLAVVDSGGDLAPRAPLFDGLFLVILLIFFRVSSRERRCCRGRRAIVSLSSTEKKKKKNERALLFFFFLQNDFSTSLALQSKTRILLFIRMEKCLKDTKRSIIERKRKIRGWMHRNGGGHLADIQFFFSFSPIF